MSQDVLQGFLVALAFTIELYQFQKFGAALEKDDDE